MCRNSSSRNVTGNRHCSAKCATTHLKKLCEVAGALALGASGGIYLKQLVLGVFES